MVVDYATIRYYLTRSGAQLEEVTANDETGDVTIFFNLPYIREMVDKMGLQINVVTITLEDKMGIGLSLIKK